MIGPCCRGRCAFSRPAPSSASTCRGPPCELSRDRFPRLRNVCTVRLRLLEVPAAPPADILLPHSKAWSPLTLLGSLLGASSTLLSRSDAVLATSEDTPAHVGFMGHILDWCISLKHDRVDKSCTRSRRVALSYVAMWCDARLRSVTQFHAVSCDVMWYDVMWCNMKFTDDMPRHATPRHAKPRYFLTWRDVTWRDEARRDVKWHDMMWRDVTWLDARWCDKIWHDTHVIASSMIRMIRVSFTFDVACCDLMWLDMPEASWYVVLWYVIILWYARIRHGLPCRGVFCHAMSCFTRLHSARIPGSATTSSPWWAGPPFSARQNIQYDMDIYSQDTLRVAAWEHTIAAITHSWCSTFAAHDRVPISHTHVLLTLLPRCSHTLSESMRAYAMSSHLYLSQMHHLVGTGKYRSGIHYKHVPFAHAIHSHPWNDVHMALSCSVVYAYS